MNTATITMDVDFLGWKKTFVMLGETKRLSTEIRFGVHVLHHFGCRLDASCKCSDWKHTTTQPSVLRVDGVSAYIQNHSFFFFFFLYISRPPIGRGSELGQMSAFGCIDSQYCTLHLYVWIKPNLQLFCARSSGHVQCSISSHIGHQPSNTLIRTRGVQCPKRGSDLFRAAVNSFLSVFCWRHGFVSEQWAWLVEGSAAPALDTLLRDGT